MAFGLHHADGASPADPTSAAAVYCDNLKAGVKGRRPLTPHAETTWEAV
jgi:hypothetical protein